LTSSGDGLSTTEAASGSRKSIFATARVYPGADFGTPGLGTVGVPMSRRYPKVPVWLLLALAGVTVALLPWTAYLSQTLPAEHVTRHWDVLWSGFDLFEALALGATALALAKRSPLASPLAAVGGTALLSDGWFDTVTARGSAELRVALFMLLAELPLAGACWWIAYAWARPVSAAGRASAAAPRPRARRAPRGEGRAVLRTRGSGAPSEGRTSR
jgi:hypothetical protein